MMNKPPAVMRATGSFGSPLSLGSRIQSTSNGAPMSSTGSLAFIVRRLDPHAHDATPAGEKLGDFGFHEEMEGRKLFRLLGYEIQKIPLRHQHHEVAARAKLREIAGDEAVVADLDADLAHFVVWAREEPLE